MKTWKIAALLGAAGLVMIATAGCSMFGGKSAAASDTATVATGDLRVMVKGSGKTLIDNDDKLAFATAGRISRINVKKGDTVAKGAVLARLETADLEQSLVQARVGLTQKQLAVKQAELAVRASQHGLNEAQDIYSWPEIEVAQTQVDEAKSYYNYVSQNAAKEGASWSGALAYAAARLAATEQRLDAMTHTYDTEEVALKRMELQIANDSLLLAQQSVTEAEGMIRQVERQIDGAMIKAQFDGVVTDVDCEEGDVVSPAVKVIRLFDPASIEVYAEIDEMDVLSVKPGQAVAVKLDCRPGDSLSGRVKSISQFPVSGSTGLVKYETRVTLEKPPVEIKAGLSATSEILVEERKNVVLVPNRAVRRGTSGATSRLAVGNEMKEVTVTIGATDGSMSEVVSGLKPGDSVSVQ
jgi:RND family efflux transporter MFP subunit